MEYYAFAFRSKLSLDEMLATLEASGHGQWHERFKDAWGEYLFGRLNPAPFHAVAKLIVEGDEFVLNVKHDPDHAGGEAEYRAVREAVEDYVLPALEAKRIRPTEYIE